MKKFIKGFYRSILVLIVIFTFLVLSLTYFTDPISSRFRLYTQNSLSNFFENLAKRNSESSLTSVEVCLLEMGAVVASGIFYWSYPEASKVLFHSIYGKGEPLILSPYYFEQSHYLKRTIARLGVGHHGPLTMHQHEDYRLSLVFNPYFLEIHPNRVRIYHPDLEFVSNGDASVYTWIRFGKLKFKFFDSIVSAVQSKAFYVSSEWVLIQDK